MPSLISIVRSVIASFWMLDVTLLQQKLQHLHSYRMERKGPSHRVFLAKPKVQEGLVIEPHTVGEFSTNNFSGMIALQADTKRKLSGRNSPGSGSQEKKEASVYWWGRSIHWVLFLSLLVFFCLIAIVAEVRTLTKKDSVSPESDASNPGRTPENKAEKTVASRPTSAETFQKNVRIASRDTE
jgi:hypothetical protein